MRKSCTLSTVLVLNLKASVIKVTALLHYKLIHAKIGGEKEKEETVLLTSLPNDHRLACMISELNREEYELDSKSLGYCRGTC